MADVYFSTGQAARELGITQAKVRALCESEAIDSVCTPGGQYRISKDEIERLRRDGLPAVPRPLPEAVPTQGVSRARSNRGAVALLAQPSQAVIGSAEEVVRLENEVKTVHLRREKEEALDWFREREDREAERETEREEAEWLRESEAAFERQRRRWEAKWIEDALTSLRWDVPQTYKLDVHRAVQETLQRIQPTSPDSITRELVQAAVARALALWHTQKRIADSIKEVCEAYSIPYQMRLDSTWRARMQAAAVAAIAQLRNGASANEMQLAAQNAVAPLVREFESVRTRAEIVDGVSTELPGAASEWEEGKDVVRAALADLPLGASRRELERARTMALAPIRSAIAARQDREARAALLRQVDFRSYSWPDKLRKRAEVEISEALNELPEGTPAAELASARKQVIERVQRVHERRERRSRLIDSGVRQIRSYVYKLAVDFDFDDTPDTIARELEEPIREILGEDLRGDETDEQVAALVRRSVREELDIP
jgi:excisionase family DNA binding protein